MASTETGRDGRDGSGSPSSEERGAASMPEWPRLLSYPFPVRAAVRRRRGMLGMVIGVGLALGMVLTMMGMIGTSMGMIMGDFGESGANLYVAVNGGELVVLKGTENPGTINGATAVLSKIRSLPGTRAAVGVLNWPLNQEREGREARSQPAQLVPAMAVDGDPTEIANHVVMSEGRWLRRGNEVVLGPNLSSSKSLKVGDSLRLNGLTYEIVGIGRMRGFGPSGGSVAYLDARTLRQRGVIGDVVNYIAVQTDAPQLVHNVIGGFASLYAVSPGDLTRDIQSSPDYSSAISTYWLIDLIILFVAGMFVSNMLSRSVAARRMEFGTLRAIGVPGRTILLSVGAEALLVILASYAFGVVFSIAMGTAANVWLAPVFGYPRLYGLDLPAYSAILVVSIAVGLIAGYFPARAATKVDPLEVLREV
ncbi:MAG: ABC transporter permease [Sphingomonadaceae bacterium]